MSNSIDTILRSLTFKGTDIQRSDFKIHLEVKRGFLESADVRGEDTIIPGATGRVPRNRKKDLRVIELEGTVRGEGATEDLRLSDFQDSCDALISLFDPAAATGTLSGTAWDGTTRSIVCRALPGNVWSMVLPGEATFNVQLLSVVPDWTTT